MPIKAHPSLELNIEEAFKHTIIAAVAADIDIELLPSSYLTEIVTGNNKFIVSRNPADIERRSNVLFITEKGSFSDPINGIVLYKIWNLKIK